MDDEWNVDSWHDGCFVSFHLPSEQSGVQKTRGGNSFGFLKCFIILHLQPLSPVLSPVGLKLTTPLLWTLETAIARLLFVLSFCFVMFPYMEGTSPQMKMSRESSWGAVTMFHDIISSFPCFVSLTFRWILLTDFVYFIDT